MVMQTLNLTVSSQDCIIAALAIGWNTYRSTI